MPHELKIELVPIELDGFHIFIKARINGKRARFLVDTGASRTVVDKARIMRFIPHKEAEFEKLESFSAGLGTNTMESHTIVLKSLSFGRMVIKDYLTAALDLSHVNQSYGMIRMKKIDGVIGGDLLYRLRAVIDYSEGQIRLF